MCNLHTHGRYLYCDRVRGELLSKPMIHSISGFVLSFYKHFFLLQLRLKRGELCKGEKKLSRQPEEAGWMVPIVQLMGDGLIPN